MSGQTEIMWGEEVAGKMTVEKDSFGHWTETTLSNLMTFGNGKVRPKSIGHIPIYGGNGILGYSSESNYNGETIVIGRVGAYCGSVYFEKGPIWVSDNALSAKPKGKNDAEYLFYLLKLHNLNQYAGGSSHPLVTHTLLNSLEFKVCTEPKEQRAIASVLNSIDSKITLLRRQNFTLESLAKTLFQQWFVGFDFPNANGSPYSSSGGEMADSEIGAIPKGWRLGVLNDIISELETGTRPKGGVSSFSFGVPSIGAESIVGIGQFDFSKTRYVPDEYFASMRRGHIKSRDVLVYKDGGTPGTFKPHISMFGDGFPFSKCCVNDHVYRLRVKNDAQNFAYLWLTSDLAMDEMHQKGTGAAIPGLNSTALKSLTTVIPNQTVLSAFEELIEPLFTRVISNSKQSQTLSTLRDTLLPKLMSGEVRVAY